MSNYSLYAPYGKRQPSGAPVEESEVDALTDLLVQSMNSSSADSDTYGKIFSVNILSLELSSHQSSRIKVSLTYLLPFLLTLK